MKKLHYKSITLITTPGRALPLMELLHKAGHTMLDIKHARGSFIGGKSLKNGTPIEIEQEILTCVTESQIADEVFAKIYDWAEVHQPNGGFMFMQDLKMSTKLSLEFETKTELAGA